MNIKVTKLTDAALLRKANSFTSGHESDMTLRTAYRLGHSTIRTQIFLVECYGIPQYVAYHLRTHFSLHLIAPEEYGWMKSKRTDRGGADFRKVCENLANGLANAFDMDCGDVSEELCDKVNDLPNHFDRYAPTDFCFMISAEGLMKLAGTRLCTKASKETREVVRGICELVEEIDPDLYPHLVKPCVACGVCRELKGCGYVKTDAFRLERERYKDLFR